MCRKAHRDRATMGVPDQDGSLKIQRRNKMPDQFCRDVEAGVDVLPALGIPRSGKIERDHMQIRTKFLDERDKRIRAAHQAVEEDNRRLVPGHRPSFKVRETEAVDLNLAAFHHGCGIFSSTLWQARATRPWTALIPSSKPIQSRSLPAQRLPRKEYVK